MKKEIVSIFGNTNNYLLRLVEILRNAGYDARLLVNRKDLLHRPEAVCPEWSGNYPDWIYDVSHIGEEDYLYETSAIYEVVAILNCSDKVILNDMGPSLAKYLKVPFNSFLTGSDLSYYANFDSIDVIANSWRQEFLEGEEGRHCIESWRKLIQRQRAGIRNSELFFYIAKDCTPANEELLREIDVADNRRRFFLLINPRLKYVPVPKNRKPVIFCGARLNFKNNFGREELDNKRVDLMIMGLGKFHRETGQEFSLVLVEKGDDVEGVKKLLAEEGIDHLTEWRGELDLKRYYDQVVNSNIIFDSLGDSMPGMVATDALTIGRPVIANTRNGLHAQALGASLPSLQADSADGVYRQLTHLWERIGEWEDMGRELSEYMISTFNSDKIIDFVRGKKQSAWLRSVVARCLPFFD